MREGVPQRDVESNSSAQETHRHGAPNAASLRERSLDPLYSDQTGHRVHADSVSTLGNRDVLRRGAPSTEDCEQ